MTDTAAKLDMSRAMVSRYLRSMEEWLGARLLHRSTRRVSLTTAGTEALSRCHEILALTDKIKINTEKDCDTPSGLIRITSSTSFAQTHLSDAITEYVARYPKTKVDILAADRTVDLVEERIDLAIRITNDLSPHLIARKLSTCHSVVCAAPSYLERHRAPTLPEDLVAHNCLTYSYFGKSLWSFSHDGKSAAISVCGSISANEVMVITKAALAGAGIALQPKYVVGPLIEAGKLVALLPDYQPTELGIYGVYASRYKMPLTTRTLLDFLAERFQHKLL